MDSSPAQDGGAAPGGEKRRRSHSVRQRYYREREWFEKVNPVPVAVLGPVPSIEEQTRDLMRDPRWLVQQMSQQEEPEERDQFDWDDDEPELFTGYELVEMEPILPPEDQRGQDSPSKDQGSGPGSESDQNPVESSTDSS